MSTSTAARPPQTTISDADPEAKLRANPVKILIGIVGMFLVLWGLGNLFLAFGYYPEKFGNKIIIGLLAIVGGVGGAYALFYFLNVFIEGLPARLAEGVIPYGFLLPGFLLVGLMLI